MRKNLFIIFIFSVLISFNQGIASNYKKSIIIDVQLSPAGSFQITSNKIKGKMVKDATGSITGKNIKIPIKFLKTGISLRDNHTRKKLGIEQNPKAFLLLTEAKGANGQGVATFKVLDKIQQSKFTFQEISNKWGEAFFELSLKKFGIIGINYMGVGVKDVVKVKVVMPYQLKK